MTAPAFLTLPEGSRPVPTNGWDVVSAVRIGDVNASISASGLYPKGFETSHGTTRAKGQFGPWQLTEEGDGQLITMRLPMHSLSFDRDSRTRQIASAAALIRVRLELLPSQRTRLTRNGLPGTEHILVIRTGVDATLLAAEPDAKAAIVLDLETDEELPLAVRAGLMNSLEDWLNGNLHEFTHVFGAVDIVQMTETEAKGVAFGWLKPSSVSYAFGPNLNWPDRSVLAFLCQTGGRSAKNLVHQTEAGVIPEGAQAGLCISYRRLLADMVGPALERSFKGLQVKAGNVKAQDTGFHFDKPIQLEPQDFEGKTYAPVIEALELTLRNSEIEIESLTRTEITPGLYSMCQNVSAFNFGLLPGPEGKTVGYKPVRQPVETHWKEQSEGINILQWMLIALMGVALIVLGLISAGMLDVPAMVAFGLLSGAGAGMATKEIIAKINEGKGPSIDLFALNASDSVRWCTGAQFEPVNAGLNGSLQIGGNLHPKERLGIQATRNAFQAQYTEIMANRRAAHGAVS